MSRVVVDASVAVKWYVPEVHSEPAGRVLESISGGLRVHAPDLVFAEFGNILWKKIRTGELSRVDAEEITRGFIDVPKTIHRSEALLPAALEIAAFSGRTVYDSLYLALAAELDCEVVTADAKLMNALTGTPWAKLVRWVEGVR